MDSQKLKGQLLKDQIAELDGKKGDLEIQLNEANLSIPEARDRILARMKEDNATIATTEKRSREVKKNIEMCEKRLREIEASLLDKKTEEEDKKKYEILYQKDKEMDEFINSFEKTREKDIEEMGVLQ
jgi:intraflagellar transport protein 74